MKCESLPLISIIVPVYNVRAYLRKCLDSICGQTYKNLEIVVVDDGSTDGSGEICDEYAQLDNRVKVIHSKNGGLSSARNIGLNNALGEYIGFVDSDDWIDYDMYEFLWELLNTRKADLAICSHYIEKQNKTKVKYVSNEVTELTSTKAIRLLSEDKIIRNYACDKLFKRYLFEELRFPLNRYFEDIAVMYKIFYNAQKIVMKGVPKYHYLIREDSIMQSLYDPKKEYHLFLAVYEQSNFILEKQMWDRTPIFVIQRGIHLIDHIMLVPPTSCTEKIVNDVLDKMHCYDTFNWQKIGLLSALKRWSIYNHLPLYRSFYYFYRLLFKLKRHRV